MAKSMNEYLHQDMQCEGLLECVYGLKTLDRTVFQALIHADEPLTVDAIAETVDRERSTAYRSIQRLLSVGFIEQEQVNYDDGGYHHVYHPVDPDRAADEMQRVLNDWYAKMGQLIQEFRDKYGTHSESIAMVD